MPIDSTSTLAQVQAAYDDNASYAAERSLAKAQAFTTAARILLRRIPMESSSRDGAVRFQMDLISKEIERAEQWIAAGNGVDAATATGQAAPLFTRVSTQFGQR